MKTAIVTCNLTETKTESIGAVINQKPAPLPIDPKAEPIEIDPVDPADLTPIGKSDLDALFLKDEKGNPIEGCGWAIESHNPDGSVNMWIGTGASNADLVVNDKRVEIRQKLPDWPVEVPAEEKPVELIDDKSTRVDIAQVRK